MKLRLSLAITLSVAGGVARTEPSAKPVTLFHPRAGALANPIAHFGGVVAELNPGTVVRFSNGREITIGHFIGKGDNSRIFEIEGEPGKAVRLPLAGEKVQFMKAFRDGKPDLDQHGIPSVKIYESFEDEYAIVERIANYEGSHQPLLLRDYLQRENQDAHLTEKLFEFVRKSARIDHIPDFGSSQLAFDPVADEWKLLDWSHSPTPLTYQAPKGLDPKDIDGAAARVERSEHALSRIVSETWAQEHRAKIQPLQEEINATVAAERLRMAHFDEAHVAAWFKDRAAAWAKPEPVTLFLPMGEDRTSAPVPGYDELVASLEPGTTVRFSDGSEFKIGQEIGSGSSTRIFEIDGEPDRALRLPKYIKHRDFMEAYSDGYIDLHEARVPSVKILDELNNEYVVVSRLTGADGKSAPLTLRKFLSEGATDPDLRAKLFDFARKTAHLQDIPDFSAAQLAYDYKHQEWKVLDWTYKWSGLERSPKAKPAQMTLKQAASEIEFVPHLFETLEIEAQKFSPEAKRATQRLLDELHVEILEERLRRSGYPAADVATWSRKRKPTRAIQLFHPAEPHKLSVAAPNYAELVRPENISGKNVRFSDGREFTLGKLLGKGGVSYVYEVEGNPDVALRVPIHDQPFRAGAPNPREFIHRFVDGHHDLAQHGIPMVKILSHLDGEYALVERIHGPPGRDSVLTLEEFLKSGAEDAKLRDALVRFARKTADVNLIPDFKPIQLAYDYAQDEWRLMDWDNEEHFAHLHGFVFNRGHLTDTAQSAREMSGMPHAFRDESFAPYRQEARFGAWFDGLDDAVTQERLLRVGQPPAQVEAWAQARRLERARARPMATIFDTRGRPHPAYEKLLQTAAYGEGLRVRFGDGREVTLGRLVGEDSLTKVFEIVGEPDHVIHVPRTAPRARNLLTNLMRGPRNDEYAIVSRLSGESPGLDSCWGRFFNPPRGKH